MCNLNKNKYICFIVESPIQSNMKSLCLFDDFLNAGYKLILIDISAVTNRTAFESTKTDLIENDYAEIYRCRSKRELYRLIFNLPKKTIVFTRIQWSPTTYGVYRKLEVKKLVYGYLSLNEMDDSETLRNLKKNGISLANPILLKRIFTGLFIRLPKRLLLKRGASFVITNLESKIDVYYQRYTATVNTKNLLLHSNVFEEGLKNKERERIVRDKYCLWLDSYIPYHPDNTKINASVDPESYYKVLRDFFHHIENLYNIKVVVAAHPKADYDKHPDAYKNFQIIKMETCMLCRDAEFVISTASQSIMYAVLYRKAILFVSQDALTEGGLQSHVIGVHTLAQQFATEVIHLDSYEDDKERLDRAMNIPEEIYDSKIKEWIKADYNGKIEGESSTEKLFKFLSPFFA